MFSQQSRVKLAYDIGCRRALEDFSKEAVVSAGFMGFKNILSGLKNLRNPALAGPAKEVPKSLWGSIPGKGHIANIGLGGGISAYLQEGDWWDKTKAFAVGGAAMGAWGPASKFLGDPMRKLVGRASGKNVNRSLIRAVGGDRGKAREAIKLHKSMTTPGLSMKEISKNEKLYKDFMSQNSTLGKRIGHSLRTDKRGLAVGATGLAGGLYLTSKLTEDANQLAGLTPPTMQPWTPQQNNPYTTRSFS